MVFGAIVRDSESVYTSIYFFACHEQHHLYRAEIAKIIITEGKKANHIHAHLLIHVWLTE